jgi:hemolysin D
MTSFLKTRYTFTACPFAGQSVEIKTGHRRLIEFFLSPLLKYGQESIRER